MEATINKNEPTTTEPLPKNGQQPKPLGLGFNELYIYQIFAPDYFVLLFSLHGGFLTITMYHHRETNLIKVTYNDKKRK